MCSSHDVLIQWQKTVISGLWKCYLHNLGLYPSQGVAQLLFIHSSVTLLLGVQWLCCRVLCRNLVKVMSRSDGRMSMWHRRKTIHRRWSNPLRGVHSNCEKTFLASRNRSGIFAKQRGNAGTFRIQELSGFRKSSPAMECWLGTRYLGHYRWYKFGTNFIHGNYGNIQDLYISILTSFCATSSAFCSSQQ